MTKLVKQLVVREQPAILPNQQVEDVALFLPDGSVYAAPESEPSEGSVVTYGNISLSGEETQTLNYQNEVEYELASLKIDYALGDTTDEFWKTILFSCSMWFFEQEVGVSQFDLEHIFGKIPELDAFYPGPPVGIKALWQGYLYGTYQVGMLTNPDDEYSSLVQVLDMVGVAHTQAMQTGDRLSFNASWLIRNNA